MRFQDILTIILICRLSGLGQLKIVMNVSSTLLRNCSEMVNTLFLLPFITVLSRMVFHISTILSYFYTNLLPLLVKLRDFSISVWHCKLEKIWKLDCKRSQDPKWHKLFKTIISSQHTIKINLEWKFPHYCMFYKYLCMFEFFFYFWILFILLFCIKG